MYSLIWLTKVQNYASLEPTVAYASFLSPSSGEARGEINRGFQQWKLWYYGTFIYYETNFGTIPKNYEALKLWYYTIINGTLIDHRRDYGAISKTTDFWFTKYKQLYFTQKLWNVDLLLEKTIWYYTTKHRNL